jgi:adenine deaminase
MQVASGRVDADLVVINARLANVYSGEVLEGHCVAVQGQWIAAVGSESAMAIGPQTRVIDARGQTLIPGLIDGHAHLCWYGCIDQFLSHLMVGGTTTVITETLEVFPVAGLDGVLDFIDACRNQPIKIFLTAPFMASVSTTTHGIDPQTLKRLLAFEDIVGLGESYWQSALQHEKGAVEAIELSLQAGKTIEGHTAGARGKKLMTYVAAGASSCHEPISGQEILERLRLGMHVMIREGSIRRDLGALLEIKALPVDYRRLILVTDGVSPADLMAAGYMEAAVQKAIDQGIDPMVAIQMATLNVAEHFALDHHIGGIAPGRHADMVLIPDIKTIEAQWVISKGRLIAKKGQLLVPPRHHTYATPSLNSVHLAHPLKAADFCIHLPRGTKKITVRVIEMVTDLVTREQLLPLKAENSVVVADPELGINKVVAIDRRRGMDKRFVGLVKGFGLKAGAIASSAAWDTADIIAVGADDHDLALAANRVAELRGGVVVCEKQTILGELPLPVFGLLSDQSMRHIVDALNSIAIKIVGLGCAFPDPVLSLVALTGAAIPFLRICEEGLVDLKTGVTQELFVG